MAVQEIETFLIPVGDDGEMIAGESIPAKVTLFADCVLVRVGTPESNVSIYIEHGPQGTAMHVAANDGDNVLIAHVNPVPEEPILQVDYATAAVASNVTKHRWI